MTDQSVFKSDVANVQYGDVAKQPKFEVASLAADGETILTAVAKPPKGHKYAVMLVGVMHKDDNPMDFDLDAALAELGYIRTDDVRALRDAVDEPDDMDRFWAGLCELLGETQPNPEPEMPETTEDTAE